MEPCWSCAYCWASFLLLLKSLGILFGRHHREDAMEEKGPAIFAFDKTKLKAITGPERAAFLLCNVLCIPWAQHLGKKPESFFPGCAGRSQRLCWITGSSSRQKDNALQRYLSCRNANPPWPTRGIAVHVCNCWHLQRCHLLTALCQEGTDSTAPGSQLCPQAKAGRYIYFIF